MFANIKEQAIFKVMRTRSDTHSISCVSRMAWKIMLATWKYVDCMVSTLCERSLIEFLPQITFELQVCEYAEFIILQT